MNSNNYKKRGQRSWKRDTSAVSEVLGTVLMVAMTIGMSVALSGLLIVLAKPTPTFHADLQIQLENDDALWGNGNERVVVLHIGGETLVASDTSIRMDVAGAVQTLRGSTQLASAFSDGEFRLGEKWSRDATIPGQARIEVSITAFGKFGGRVVAHQIFNASGDACLSDLTPPTAQSWVEVPADVSGATSGSVEVTLTATDDCSGVDNQVSPILKYRLQDGTSPAFTDGGAMARIGINRWTATIPDLGWAANVGSTLQFFADGVTDLRGNAGATVVATDPIQGGSPITRYVSSNAPVVGTVTDFVNAQSNSSLEATLREGSTPSTNVFQVYTNTVVQEKDTPQAFRALGPPDDLFAVIQKKGGLVEVGYSAPPPFSGTITKVEMVVKAKAVPEPGEVLKGTEKLRLDPSTGPARDILITAAANTVLIDITSDRALWLWSNIQAATLEAKSETGSDKIDAHIDVLYLRVTATGAGFAMNIEFRWTGVLPAVQHDVQMMVRVVGAETYRVEVWDGAAWNTRHDAITSATLQPWNYRLQAAEFNGGAPKLRFMDANPLGSPAGEVYVQFARLISA